jgi:hypothetical protein
MRVISLPSKNPAPLAAYPAGRRGALSGSCPLPSGYQDAALFAGALPHDRHRVGNGRIYESDITRGLFVWDLDDRDADDAVRLRHLNPQTQEFRIGAKRDDDRWNDGDRWHDDGDDDRGDDDD